MGMYVSFDDGENWQPLQMNLPAVPVTDCVVHEDDLVVSTQGRSFWILDNLTPLHQMTGEVIAAPAHLFAPRQAYHANGYAAVIDFHLSDELAESDNFALEFLDKDGGVIRTFKREKDKQDSSPNDVFVDDEEGVSESDPQAVAEPDVEPEEDIKEPAGEIAPAPPAVPEGEAADPSTLQQPVSDEEEADEEEEDDPIIGRMEVKPGMNRFELNLRYAGAMEVPDAVFWGGNGDGPKAPPGAYQVRLTGGDIVQTQSFSVVGDPRIQTTQEEYDEAFRFLLTVRDKVDAAHRAVKRIRSIREQIDSVVKRAKDHESSQQFKDEAKSIGEKLEAIESAIIQTKSRSGQDPLHFPIRLNDKIASLAGVVEGSNAKPTDQAWAVLNELSSQLDAELAKLDEVIANDVAAFNQMVSEKAIPAIVIDDE